MSDEAINRLIGQVYDAALDESLWEALSTEIPKTLASSSVVTFTVDSALNQAKFLIQSSLFTPKLMNDYETYYCRQDVWAARGAELGLSKVWCSNDLIDDHELHRTEIYNDWLLPLDLAYVVGSVWRIDAGTLCGFGIHRSYDRGAYDEEDKRRVSLFLPHLQRALQIRQRLATAGIEKYAALDGLERTGTAVLVTDRDGRVLFADRLAELVLNQGDAIRVMGGRLVCINRTISERMMFFIRGAVGVAAGFNGNAGGAISIPRNDRLPLTVLVAPFRPGNNTPVPAAFLFIKDPETPSVTAKTLQSLFGFTASEACVAAALAGGHSVDTIASTLQVSLNTVRTHLKSIMAKSGTTRQAELVALLLRSVASMDGR